jgi:hypothetical protein
MCGDVEEEGPSELEDQLYLRFLSHARSLLAEHGRHEGDAGKDMAAYMDKLFADALSRSARDGEEAEEGKRYDRLSVQPVVFARLAGFLAAHLALQEDPLRKVMEAMMMGYAEAEQIEPDHGHDHDHDHDHGHSHGHGHDHHH